MSKRKKVRRTVAQRTPGTYNPGSGKAQTKVRATSAPATLHTHLPAPEAKAVSAKLSKEAVKAAEKAEREKLFARFLSGEAVPTKAQAEALSAERLHGLCRACGWAGHSGLTKAELVEHVTSGGVAHAPKGRTGPKAEELRKECKGRREDAKAKGTDAYRGYSSQNKAGLSFMLDNGGAKPTLKDGTYKVGTVSWLQQLCRETGIKGFSGLKKADLISHVFAKGNAEAKKALKAAIEQGQMEAALPLLRKLGLAK